jgi:hypothetical protein
MLGSVCFAIAGLGDWNSLWIRDFDCVSVSKEKLDRSGPKDEGDARTIRAASWNERTRSVFCKKESLICSE